MVETSAVSNTKERMYPETGAGGFSRIDGTVQFFSRVAALTGPQDVVLDLGAGRGENYLEDPVPYRRALLTHRGRCAKVIGADVDPVVMDNPSLDEAHVVGPDQKLPIDDNSIDIICSDFTLEHIDDPALFASEIDRVLKSGGWFCARTPNKWGYISLGANLIPNKYHVKLLRILQPGRKAEDVFPTRYRLNTISDLKRHFPPARFNHHSFTWNAEPAYFGANSIAWRIMMVIQSILPRALGSTLMVFVQKTK